ncbi:hypothetical protein [Candidatus Parabeggiatoa sp. HSG14]|uniref:hypothetical protein n=1 Tax=Candidatus Parabeggiatoa sp. HSG14 TaxID=3055593 RepID=UPI0025A8028E|nr:hypothetical protein [Thiotrichales bacterium HSG14]
MKEFLLIGKRPTHKINDAAVGVNDYKFYNRLSTQFKETLIYPRDEYHETFCCAVTQEKDYLSIFVSNKRPEDFKKDFPSLLFFSYALEANTLRFMRKTESGREENVAFYHAITSERGLKILSMKKIALAYDDNKTLWQHKSSLSQHLFIQETKDDYQPNGYKVIIQRPNKLPETKNTVWVNPICLRLPLMGGELNPETFQLWEENTEPLWLEPLFQNEQAPLIQFYQHGEEQIKSKKSLSRIEKLIWGNSTNQNDYYRWQVFAALDALQGHFHLNNQSQYYWEPPKTLSPNARYFADYWLKRWHGKEEKDIIHNDNKPISPPSYTPTFRYTTNTMDVPFNNNHHNREKLFEDFSLLEQSAFKMISAILKDCPDSHVANDLHRGYLTIHENQNGQYSLNFNANAYLYEFAQRYIVPFSPITVAFPQPVFKEKSGVTDFLKAQKKYYESDIEKLEERFDLIKSTFHGARGFFQQLCDCLENGLQDDNFEPPLQNGWWNHWHEWLYSHSIQSQFIFTLPPIQQPTRVGQAKVGENTFVGGHKNYRQDKIEMCF